MVICPLLSVAVAVKKKSPGAKPARLKDAANGDFAVLMTCTFPKVSTSVTVAPDLLVPNVPEIGSVPPFTSSPLKGASRVK